MRDSIRPFPSLHLSQIKRDQRNDGGEEEELPISMSTLRNHISHIKQKLHAKNRTEAVMKALKRGII